MLEEAAFDSKGKQTRVAIAILQPCSNSVLPHISVHMDKKRDRNYVQAGNHSDLVLETPVFIVQSAADCSHGSIVLDQLVLSCLL